MPLLGRKPISLASALLTLSSIFRPGYFFESFFGVSDDPFTIFRKKGLRKTNAYFVYGLKQLQREIASSPVEPYNLLAQVVLAQVGSPSNDKGRTRTNKTLAI